ncbi:phage tail tip fiber protein [Haematobacter massiliensis]|uniref:phage tail tip fiber protein n=1 Tax=Haematobacter massiliensis TaxID=195105 RepID=UPI0023F48883|nr:hypothetical protein [Haematobacter massiliensis]
MGKGLKGILGAALVIGSFYLPGVGAIAALGKVGAAAVAWAAGSVGSALLNTSILARSQSVGAQGVTAQIQFGDDLPLSFTVGRYATAGKRRYAGVWGNPGNTPNAALVDVIALGDLPVSGMSGLWINDERVTLGATAHPDGRGYPVNEIVNRKGEPRVWVRFYDGTQTAADPYLVAKFGVHPDRPWTAEMVGRGVPYVIVTAVFDADVMSQQPAVLVELDGIRVYDLRRDSTAGGLGPQRWADPATWEASSNPAVIAYTIIRGLYFGSEWVWGGQNLPAWRLPASAWIAAATACDEPAELEGGGTEAAYRCGYEVRGDVAPLDVLRHICTAANMRIAEVGGVFKPLVGLPASAVYAFTDADIVVTDDQSLEPFPALDATYNRVDATYPEPAERWTMKDAPRRIDADAVTADGGRELPASVAYAAAPFAAQVQRLQQSQLAEYRRFRTHQIVLPPEVWPLEPVIDLVSWTSARNGYQDKKFLITHIVKRRGACVVVMLREVDPSDYDWHGSQQLPIVTGWIGRIDPPAQVLTGWQAEGIAVTDDQGRARRPAVRVSCDGDRVGVTHVRAQLRVKGQDAILHDTDALPYDAPFAWILAPASLSPDTLYQVRGVYVSGQAVYAQWSDWVEVRTPDVRLTALDVVYGEGTVEELAARLDDWIEWAGAGTRDLLEQLRANIVRNIDAEAAAYTDRRRLRRELTSTRQGITASYREEIIAATGPGSALVQALTDLNAAIEGKASASALSALSTRVSETMDEVDALAQSLQELVVTIAGKADASTVTALQAQVTQNGTDITAVSNALSQTNATVGNMSASGLIRIYSVANSGGSLSRIAIRSAATSGEANSARSAAMFFEAIAGGLSRVAINADQFAVINGDARESPFIVQNGVVKMRSAVIDNLIVRGSLQVGSVSDVQTRAAVDAVTASNTIFTDTILTIGSTNSGDVIQIGATVEMNANGTDRTLRCMWQFYAEGAWQSGGDVAPSNFRHGNTYFRPWGVAGSIPGGFSQVRVFFYAASTGVTIRNARIQSGIVRR